MMVQLPGGRGPPALHSCRTRGRLQIAVPCHAKHRRRVSNSQPLVRVQDKLSGQTRQSRSERQEVQDASRRAEGGQGPEALAQQLENAPEAEQQLLVRQAPAS